MEITLYLADCIRNRTPVSFLKYGDGEHLCATNCIGENCDKDRYTEKLAEGLRTSFKYMVDEAPNTYIGKWHNDDNLEFWSNLVQKPIRIAKYHSIIMDKENRAEKVDLLKTIKESSLKKIYICNPLMVRAKSLLNIDYMVYVPFNNWFDTEKDNILCEIESYIQPEDQYIVMTSAGMGAKILIAELSKKYPQNIYLDIGSALDKICTKKATRGWEPAYMELMDNLKDLLPEDWESPVYQPIFNEARHKVGVHAEWLNLYI